MSAPARPAVRSVPVDPRSDPLWEALAARGRGGLFVAPPWIDAICGTYGFDPRARVCLGPDGAPLGGFAWVAVDDVLGRRVLSLPFSERADPPVEDAATWEAVSAEPFTLGAPVTVRMLDDPAAPPLHDRRLERAGVAAWHGTTLDCSLEELGTRIGSSARRNIRIAERRGVRVVASDGIDALRRFHDLHVALRKEKYGLLAQPVELFERIWHAFAPRGGVVTLLATVDDVLAAGAVFLVWEGTLYYKFSASRAEFRSMYPNNAVTWAAIRLAAERGLREVDWGLSDLDQPGLLGYKRQWASVERRIVTLRSPPVDGPADAGRTEVRRLLGDLTSLLTDPAVPDDVTARAGGLLYRYFC